MRDLNELNNLRDTSPEIFERFGSYGDSYGGVFIVRSLADVHPMTVIASNGEGWDHVSVSRDDRCPTWSELEHVRRQFFKEDETVMQLHVPLKEHVNVHPFCLHLWRPHDVEIPRPPEFMV